MATWDSYRDQNFRQPQSDLLRPRTPAAQRRGAGHHAQNYERLDRYCAVPIGKAYMLAWLAYIAVLVEAVRVSTPWLIRHLTMLDA